MGRMRYPKNPSFYTDFKNVNLTFVKSSPKKGLAKKSIFPGLMYVNEPSDSKKQKSKQNWIFVIFND
jgi:hypothetical protein